MDQIALIFGTQELMIECNNVIVTKPKEVAAIMNHFYINIAAHIGKDFNDNCI